MEKVEAAKSRFSLVNLLVKSLTKQLQEKIAAIEKLEAQLDEYEAKIVDIFKQLATAQQTIQLNEKQLFGFESEEHDY